jgi:hypothetical protein
MSKLNASLVLLERTHVPLRYVGHLKYERAVLVADGR